VAGRGELVDAKDLKLLFDIFSDIPEVGGARTKLLRET
jgi:hypothetical protein